LLKKDKSEPNGESDAVDDDEDEGEMGGERKKGRNL
jgi:hypothetical protein